MTKVESKFFDWVSKNIAWIFLVIITLLGVLLRVFGMNFESGDFQSFLNPWWGTIESGGIGGLATQVGNYNIPYQIITYILTLLPFGALYSYKIFSIIFDLLLAVAAALFVHSISEKNQKLKAIIAYSLTWCGISVILNSAFWAQCDSIYVSLILLALYFLKKDKNIASFIFVGIAFAFKLQTVFILPFYIIYYISTRKCSILHFLIIPAVDFIMCLPVVFMGRPISDLVTIYLDQTDYGKSIYMNCPNFWALICQDNSVDNYTLFKTFSVVLTFALLFAALALIVYKKSDILKKENLLLTAIWSVFTCIMFLSSMHERYGYLLDILTLIYAVVYCRRFWLPIICELVTLRGYCYYMFSYEVLSMPVTALIYFALYLYVTYIFVKEVIFDKAGSSKQIDDSEKLIKKSIKA